jgi:hypothetical protein
MTVTDSISSEPFAMGTSTDGVAVSAIAAIASLAGTNSGKRNVFLSNENDAEHETCKAFDSGVHVDSAIST